MADQENQSAAQASAAADADPSNVNGATSNQDSEDVEMKEEPHQQDCWIDIIENEDLDARYSTLAKLQMTLSRSQKMKDTKKAYRQKTMCVFPVTSGDLANGFLTPYVEKSIYVGSWFTVGQEAFAKTMSKGVCYITYQREEMLTEHMTLLKSEKPDLNVSQLSVLFKNLFGDAEPSIFDADDEDKKLIGSQPPGYELILNNIRQVPYHSEDLMLYTSTIDKEVTMETLLDMFPLSKSINMFTIPFFRVYINFDTETKLQENIAALKAQQATLPPFQLCRVSDARQAFIKIVHPKRNRRSKAPKQGSNMPGPAGVGSQGALPVNANAPLTSPTQQAGALTPSGAGGNLQQRTDGSQPGSAGQTPGQGSSDTVAQDGSDSLSGQQKLSRGQMKRLKRKQGKMRQEMEQQQQPQQQQQQQQLQQHPQQQLTQMMGQSSDINAGLALLQTLTSLAQNMSHNMPQFGAVNKMGPPSNPPPAQGPQQSARQGNNPGPRARKRMKRERKQQQQLQQQQQQAGGTPMLQQLYDHRQQQPPQNSSTQAPGQIDEGDVKQQPAGTKKPNRRRRNQKRKNSFASQQSEVESAQPMAYDTTPQSSSYGQNFATQDYTSFEASAQDSSSIAQYGNAGMNQDYYGSSSLGYGGQGLTSDQSQNSYSSMSYNQYSY